MLVGSGFSREDIKALTLRSNSVESVVGGKIFFSVTDLAWLIVRLSQADAPSQVSPLLRQDYFRLLLGHPSMLDRFPELRKLRRRPGFWRMLDQAVQAARQTSLHEEERHAQFSRLVAAGVLAGGPRAVQEEILALSSAFEGWLGSQSLLDDLGALKLASQILSAKGLPPDYGFEAGELWCNLPPEAVESEFLSELGRRIPVEIRNPREGACPSAVIERWHTVEDAAEALGDALAGVIEAGEDPASQVVLIPDSDPAARLALRRVFAERGITELDPRDPLEIRLSESIKAIFRPLELVASRFERVALLEWLAFDGGLEAGTLARAAELLAQAGVREGFEASLGALAPLLTLLPVPVVASLQALGRLSRGRVSLQQLAQAAVRSSDPRLSEWIERFWKTLLDDLKLLGIENERFPVALWMERVRSRLEQTQAPPNRTRPVTGVRVVRASQCSPELEDVRLWFFGLPAQYLSISAAASRVGDAFLRTRERDLLGVEFAVHSSTVLRDSRVRAIRSWLGSAAALHVLDFQFESDGSERETLELLFRELGASIEVLEMGAHPRFLQSHALVTEARSREVRLAGLREARLSATSLDALSRCPFLGLVQGRWKLRGAEDPELELWPTTSGNLLHRAVELLVTDIETSASSVRADESLACRRALSRAWSEARDARKLQGWVETPQLGAQIERRMVERLQAFLEAEWKYRDRAQTRVMAVEDAAVLEWRFESKGRSVEIRGKADRIDEHPEGLFVMDYKSGKQDLKGSDMRELGYRLQLPFYAIGARQKFGRPVLGVQFVELGRDARRSVGLFPERLNGKVKGSLTQVRSNNASLFAGEPEDLWAELEFRIQDRVSAFLEGVHDSRPVIGAKECSSCRVRMACGEARREWLEGDAISSEGNAEAKND